VSGFQNFLTKYIKSAPIKSAISTGKVRTTVVRVKLTTAHTAEIDISYSARFTVWLVSWTQHYIWTKWL